MFLTVSASLGLVGLASLVSVVSAYVMAYAINAVAATTTGRVHPTTPLDAKNRRISIVVQNGTGSDPEAIVP